MKVSAVALLASGIEASHFRAVAYEITQGATDGTLQLSRTLAWSRTGGGYSGGCTATHVANQTPAIVGSESCTLNSGGGCGNPSATYIVTDIEDQYDYANNYCYGYQVEPFTKPAGPFSMRWGGGCWVALTGDNGAGAGGCSYGFIAQVNDITNNSPQVKIPPVWKILSGCPDQRLPLNPVDLDNDVIKCRWADTAEAGGAVHNAAFASLSLDEENCVVIYDGTVDLTKTGVKPIAVQVEDYDADGNIRSSMPVQFLATVWTPSNFQFNNRELAMHGPGDVFKMPPIFPLDDFDGHHDDFDGGRRRRDAPNYCAAAPSFIGVSPAAGSVINVPVDGVTVTIQAESDNGAITRFSYNSPLGMTCTPIDANGQATCTFVPTAEQQGQVHNFCFTAEDGAGMTSERRCVTLAAGVTVIAGGGGNAAEVTEIFSLIKHVDAELDGEFANYGCAGLGNMNATMKTLGKTVDGVDAALNTRKHCVICANGAHGDYIEYNFDESENTCGMLLGFYNKNPKFSRKNQNAKKFCRNLMEIT